MAHKRGLRDLAEAYVGSPASLSALGGERDTNMRVRAGGDDFVMKIGEPATEEFARYEVALLDHLAAADPELPVPRVLRPHAGDALQQWNPDAGPPRLVRMYTFLPGSPLRDAAPAILYDVGRMLARLDRALAAVPPPPRRRIDWDLRAAPTLRDRLAGLDDPALAHRALDRYESSTADRLAELPRQLIHNDANPDNVRHCPGDSVTGLIDFGDAVEAPPIQELATACAYQMATGLDAVTALVRGYHSRRRLSDSEISLLPGLIGARQVLSVALSARNAGNRPDNGEYLMRNFACCWAGLNRLDRLGEERVENILHEAIRSEESDR